MTTVNPCVKCGVTPLPYVAYGVSNWVSHKCQGTTRSCDSREWNRQNPLPAPKAQGEPMKSKLWLDGSKTPPEVGSVIRWRDKLDLVNSNGVCQVADYGQSWAGADYYVLEEAPREYAPPVEPLPELEPTRDYGSTRETEACGSWWIELIKLDGVAITVKHIDRATARRMFNAAVKAMKGEA